MAAALLSVVAPNRGLPAARFPRRAASASNAGSGVSSSSFEVTPAHIAKGEVAREWVADVFENVDYELALSSSDAIEASGEYVRREDEDEELRYGEFDMGFFVAVLEACEPLLAEVEGTMDPSGAPGAFVDVGSGRGQIPVLAAALRSWSQCAGLEYVPVLHAIAEQAPTCLEKLAASEVARDDADESGRAAERENAMPSFDSPAPLSFARGDMYDADALTDATRGASMVFMFSTKFAVDRDGRLAVSPMLRPALATGAVVVTVNNELATADGFELVARADGPDGERSGGSTAYVWRAV